MKEKNFEDFISKVESQLPDLVSNDDLINSGLFAHHTALFRIRQKGAIPYLKLTNARILYLKSDVIEWVKRTYREPKDCLEGCANDA